MAKYIRVPLTEAMEQDYKECAEMIDDGHEKNCEETIVQQPTAFDKEKVLEELKGEIELVTHKPMIAGRYVKKSRTVEIIERGGID